MKNLFLLVILFCLTAISFGQTSAFAPVALTAAPPLPPTPHPRPAQSPGVTFQSTDTALQNAFAWAKQMALHYQSTSDDPVGPWYESALPPRYAFCMRDVSHQCIGAEILGMHKENRNMFSKFTSHMSTSKDWCSYWEIDKFDRPSPSDYRSDREFWYNLNANFDLMDACWRSWLYTGDSIYLYNPVFRNFYDRSADDYIKKWVLQPDSLLTRPAHPNAPIPFNNDDAFDRCRGLPSYSEGIQNIKMGVDLLAALYRGLTSYAAILQTLGDTQKAARIRELATAYREHIDADWWDNKTGAYHTYYSNDNQFGKSEGETFLLWFDALKDSARERKTIEHLLSMDLNVENLSYLPLQFYRRGYRTQARTLILHLADPATKRREYPEVSYGLVEGIVQGLMGVEGDASTNTVSTLYRVGSAPASPSARLTSLPILNTTLTVIHHSAARSTLINTGKHAIVWKACFESEQDHHISFTKVTVKPGQRKTISANSIKP
jgi:hypothetical protein